MPLREPDMYGTASGGERIEDYCIHCYRDGGFTSDVTMDEMMRLCADYAGGNKRYYMANMKTLYPHLKRWAGKKDTESEYYKSINRVIEYVKSHLGGNIDLKTLAGVARISPYHFHRIFRSVMGEPLAGYVCRLRMEYVAGRLKTSAHSLAELAQMTGYSSEQALSRAFKNYFDIPPKTFKATFFRETFGSELVPRICRVAGKNVMMLKERLSGGRGWQKLYMYAVLNRSMSDTTESVEVISGDEWRPALSVRENPHEDGHIEISTLPEGLYAIFTHRGDRGRVPELYAAVDNFWLPASKYRKGAGVPYAVYLNNPFVVSADLLLTEIYVPLTGRE